VTVAVILILLLAASSLVPTLFNAAEPRRLFNSEDRKIGSEINCTIHAKKDHITDVAFAGFSTSAAQQEVN
jgi:hypothetical protein